MLLLCNVILTVAAGTVLLGTLYPLLIDALGMGKISVGPPYFNAVFVPLVLVLFGFMGIGPIIRWKKATQGELKRQLMIPAIIALLVGLAAPFLAGGEFNAWVAAGITAAVWIALATLREGYNLIKSKEGELSLFRLSRSQLGMLLAHLGIAVSVVGATMASNYTIEKSVRMGPGISQELAGYTFKFVDIKNVQGPNYTAKQGQVEIYRGDNLLARLKPERRQYNVSTMDMTEAGIDWGLFRDLYVTMGDPVSDTEFAVRLNYKPFVRWLWFGGIFMAIGGLFAASDKRYRTRSTAAVAVQEKLATA